MTEMPEVDMKYVIDALRQRAEQAEATFNAVRIYIALLEAEQTAIAQVVPAKFQAATLLDRVTLLVAQHQHDDGRCRVWEQEATEARQKAEREWCRAENADAKDTLTEEEALNARRAALEEAAQICKRIGDECGSLGGSALAAETEIRARKEQP